MDSRACESDTAPRAEAEQDDVDEDEEEENEPEREEEHQTGDEVASSVPGLEEARSVLLSEEEDQRSEVKGRSWRDDSRSIVSGYSTLSTLGRSLGSEGRAEDADDEQSELVSETDNESGFASRSLTQERPEKRTPPPTQSHTPPEPIAPRSFLYTHHKSMPASPDHAPASSSKIIPSETERGSAGRSSTASTSSYSSTASQKCQNRAFNSHRLIQCDTLARRRTKFEKAKAHSLDPLEVSSGSTTEKHSPSRSTSLRINLMESEPQITLPLTTIGHGSLAEQVRARLLVSADDLRLADLRKPKKPLSPETRRRRRAWRRHTVVVSPTSEPQKPLTPPNSVVNNNNNKKPPTPPPKPVSLIRRPADRLPPQCSSTSRFHEYV